jgi:ABC-2 type transport system permease protein
MKGFLQLISANAKDIIRDRMSIFWFLAFPILFILLFGTIFGGNQDSAKYSVGLVIEGQTPVGAAVQSAFRSIPVFELHQGTRAKELKALQAGKRSIVVVVPQNSARFNGTGPPLEIPVYYDPGKITTTQILINSVKEVLAEIERRMAGTPKLILIKPVKAEVVKLKNIDYLLPGILAMALMQLGLFGALNFVSLRERKIIRRLGATPLPRSMMIWSEIVVRLGMAVIQTIVIVILGYVAFKVTITGNILLVMSMVLLGSGVFIALGYFLVNFTKTEESAQGLIQVFQFPMMFLSGIFFPMEILPSFLKPIVNLLPLTYLGDLLRYVMVGLPSAYGFWTDLAVLSGWFLAALALGVRFFKWE